MRANALQAWLYRATNRNFLVPSRRQKLATAAGIILIVGPSFFGVVASSHRPTDRPLTKQARPNRPTPIEGHAIGSPDRSNLTALQARGVPILPLLGAGERFHASLTPEDQARSTFPSSASEWLDRTNPATSSGGGIPFAAMTRDQRDAAIALIQATLAVPSLHPDAVIPQLQAALTECWSNPMLGHFTLLGRPSADEPWGWQVDSPRLIVTGFVAVDQVVITPNRLDPLANDHLAALEPRQLTSE